MGVNCTSHTGPGGGYASCSGRSHEDARCTDVSLMFAAARCSLSCRDGGGSFRMDGGHQLGECDTGSTSVSPRQDAACRAKSSIAAIRIAS